MTGLRPGPHTGVSGALHVSVLCPAVPLCSDPCAAATAWVRAWAWEGPWVLVRVCGGKCKAGQGVDFCCWVTGALDLALRVSPAVRGPQWLVGAASRGRQRVSAGELCLPAEAPSRLSAAMCSRVAGPESRQRCCLPPSRTFLCNTGSDVGCAVPRSSGRGTGCSEATLSLGGGCFWKHSKAPSRPQGVQR